MAFCKYIYLHGRPIVRAQKPDSFLCDFGKLQETDHLEPMSDDDKPEQILTLKRTTPILIKIINGNMVYLPTTVCQDVAGPSLQRMRASDLIQRPLAGLQAKMVRVVEAEFASCSCKLCRGETFKGSLCGHGHEHGQLDWSMG